MNGAYRLPSMIHRLAHCSIGKYVWLIGPFRLELSSILCIIHTRSYRVRLQLLHFAQYEHTCLLVVLSKCIGIPDDRPLLGMLPCMNMPTLACPWNLLRRLRRRTVELVP
jgi:hypothetical protein